tara:strand:+ start:294 stop:755 length:462 start_codon:yes stop_codon:yes gene_type:complete
MADKQIGQLEDEKTQPLDADYLVVDSNTGTIDPATNLPIYATYKVPAEGLQAYLLDDGVTSVTNKAPTSNAVKTQLDKLIPFEFALVAPQSVFNIVHNRNANVVSIKFTDASNPLNALGSVPDYFESIDKNSVSFTTSVPLETGTKIKIYFNF